MLENCLLRMDERKNVDDSISVTIKKRHSASELPLKKRYQPFIVCANSDNKDDSSCDTSTNSPVDFTLPNRIRANFSNTFCKTDVEEGHKITSTDLLTFVNNNSSKSKDHQSNGVFLSPTSTRSSFNLSSQIPLELSLRMLFPSFLWPIKREPVESNVDCNHVIETKTNLVHIPEIEDSQPLPVERYKSKNGKCKKVLKNVPLERRMEANARERTRVHTISAAFDNVRHLLPCLSADQKLSKLSILRLACNYILLLAAMNGLDYSADEQNFSVEDCVALFTDTLSAEAKFKRF